MSQVIGDTYMLRGQVISPDIRARMSAVSQRSSWGSERRLNILNFLPELLNLVLSVTIDWTTESRCTYSRLLKGPCRGQNKLPGHRGWRTASHRGKYVSRDVNREAAVAHRMHVDVHVLSTLSTVIWINERR